MKHNKSSKILAIILGLLIVLYFATNYFTDRSKSSVEIAVIDIDTTKLAQIRLFPLSAQKKEIMFKKIDGEWNVKKDAISADVHSGQMQNLLTALSELKINRLISKKQEKWDEYRVSDSLASEIKLYDANGDELLHLYCGRIKYSQPAGGYGQYGGRNLSGDTYVRLYDGNIYTVKGFLTMTLDRDFDSWRNNDFIALPGDNVTKIAFNYPADSSFVLQKVDSVWQINGVSADSAKTAMYVQALQNNSIATFVNDFVPQNNPHMTMIVSGNNMEDVTVKCFVDTVANQYILESSQNEGVYALSNESGLFGRLMKSKTDFLQK